MAIIRLGSLADKNKRDFAVGEVTAGRAVRDANFKDTGEFYQGPFIQYCTYQTHHGLCIIDSECNGRDDSDWYMLVWNEDKHEPESILFASTRGWSYPCYGSAPDASDETKTAYAQYQFAQSWKADRARYVRLIEGARSHRANVLTIVKASGCSTQRAYRLANLLGRDMTARIAALWKPTIHSGFKKSIREQIAAWLRDPSPKYQTPLSKRQMDFI